MLDAHAANAERKDPQDARKRAEDSEPERSGRTHGATQRRSRREGGRRAKPRRKPAPRTAAPRRSSEAARRAPAEHGGRARQARARQRSPRRGAPRRRQPRASTSTASSAPSEPLSFGPIGIGAEPADVYTVHYQDIAAVVSDTPIEVHDPTRENVLAHERVNETVMQQAHGHPDVVRHGVQDRRRHRRAAAVGLRRVQRRAEQDAGQARVRPEGAVGSRPDHPRDRGRGRGHPPAEERDLVAEGLDLLRAHAVRPADRRGAAVAVGALRRRDLRRAARRLGRVAHRTSRSATR